jgi:hypothetical protein
MQQLEYFEGPKLKIARGRRHVAELNAELSAYLKTDPGAVFLEADINTGKKRIVLKFRDGRCIPKEFPGIFGDAVHNFRTALDILANELVSLGRVKPKKVYFPFGKDAAGFEAELKAKMGQASDAIKDIVRSLKPYIGGNDLLRAIHDLDIGDKHIAIMKIGYQGLTDALPMRKIGSHSLPGGGGRLYFEVDADSIDTIQIDMTGFSDKAPYQTIGKMVGSEINCTIADNLPLQGTPVVEALNKMGDLAQSIVKTFEAHCFG